MNKLKIMAACAVVAGSANADIVYEVASGQSQTFSGINTSERVIFKGGGTYILEDGNTFGGGVVVSNGVLAADYAASGLSATHLSLVGTGNGNSSLAMFRPKGATFTAPVASTGAGTISFEKYAGLSPNDQTLTVNLGGDERVLKQQTDGFTTYEFILGFSKEHDLIFKNGIDLNGNNFTLKNPNSTKPAYFDGALMNSGGSSNKFTYWDGTTIFRGKTDRVDFGEKIEWQPQNGSFVFTNATIRLSKTYWAGNGDAVLNLTFSDGTTLNNSNTGGSVYFGGKGSTMLVDGSTLDFTGNVHFGNDNKEANLIVTNNAIIKAKSVNVRSGAIDQYSGEVSMTNGSSADVYLGQNDGQTIYTLMGGTLTIPKDRWWRAGNGNKTWGLLNQLGGTISIFEALEVGYNNGFAAVNIHGGVYENIRNQNDRAIVIGSGGKGFLSVANGGIFRALNAKMGVRLASNDQSEGMLSLDPLGEIEVYKIETSGGTSEMIFNGGTFRPVASDAAANPIVTSKPIAVTKLGGAFDTNGKGDFILPTALVASDDLLTHRWTFENGSLVDSVGGVTAEIVGSGVTMSDGSVLLSGGNDGTSQIKLGKGLIGTKISGWSGEVVFTQKSFIYNTPLILFNLDKYNGFSVNINKWKGWGVIACGSEFSGNYPLVDDIPYRVLFAVEPANGGRWKITASLYNAETGELYEEVSGRSSSRWTLTQFNENSECWIGKSAWADKSPNVEIREVRLYDRAMTSIERNWRADVAANGVRYFTKKGVGTLTMTGANTYEAGTAVEGGTLKLAANATLPATPVKVDAGAVLDLSEQGVTQQAGKLSGTGTIHGGVVTVDDAIAPGDADGVGTLTLDGTTLSATKFVATVGADGTCGNLGGTGTMNVNQMVVEVANPDALVKGMTYHIVCGLNVTGKPTAGSSIPNSWKVYTSPNGIKISSGGFAVILR